MDKSEKEIMDATNSALQKHSYSELSIQNIADEFEKSKSLLYHHYDGKDEILLDFLDHMLEQFREEALSEEDKEFGDRFEDRAFMAFDICQDCDFLKTLTELRTHALRDERYREKFDRFEELYTERVQELLEEGQRKAEFRQDFEPEDLANFVSLINHEALYRRAEDRDLEDSREELRNYLRSRVFRLD
ncbi:MAG: TetR/AcrR family transcriptional regulator [Candidatus Nanosalina sp.]